MSELHIKDEDIASKASLPLATGRKRKRPTFLTMDQKQIEITIGEGKDKKTFTMHKDLLHYHTSYFRDNSIKIIHLSDVSEPTLRLFHLWLYGQCSREIPDLDVDEIKCELSAKRHKGAGNNEQLFPVQEPLFLGGELLDEADQEEIKEEFEEYSSASDDTSDSEAGSNESNVDPQELMNEVSALAEETREIRQGRQWLVVSEDSLFWKDLIEHLDIFLDLYVFATTYDVPQLKRDIFTVLVEMDTVDYQFKDTYPTVDVSRLYRMLDGNSPFCKYVAKSHALAWEATENDRDRIMQFPPAYLADLLIFKEQRAAVSDNAFEEDVWNHCAYHQHKSYLQELRCKESRSSDVPFLTNFLKAIVAEAELEAERDAGYDEELDVNEEPNVDEEPNADKEPNVDEEPIGNEE